MLWRYGIPNYKYSSCTQLYVWTRARLQQHTYTVSHTDTHTHTYICRLHGALYVVWMCLFLCVLLEYELQPSSLPLLLPTSKSARTINNISAGEEEEDNNERRRGDNTNNNSWRRAASMTTTKACMRCCVLPPDMSTHRCLRRSQLRPKNTTEADQQQFAVCVVKEHTSKGKYNNRYSDDSHYRLRVSFRANVIALCAVNSRMWRIWWDRDRASLLLAAWVGDDGKCEWWTVEQQNVSSLFFLCYFDFV